MLDRSEQEILIAWIRELIDRWGYGTYVTAPIIEPTDAFFPDPYTPDLAGVRTIARRLFTYVGFRDLEVEVEGIAEVDADPLALGISRLVEVNRRAATIAVVGLSAPEDQPLMLAHEVARAFPHLRAEPARGEHPYRAAAAVDEDTEVDNRLEEEVTITAFYLGFGLLATMGADRYKATGSLEGTVAVTRWAHLCLGALRSHEACFLLALAAVAREIEESQIKGWRAHLGLNERTWLANYIEELTPRAEELRAALGLPPRDEWPKPWDEAVEPCEDDGWTPAWLDPDDEPEPTSVVFRVRKHRGWQLGGAMGVAMTVASGYAIGEGLPEAIFAIPVLAGLGYLIGRRVPQPAICSFCEGTLEENASHCRGCRGEIRGFIEPGETHLDAIERMDDVSAFGIVAAEQLDAAPRYRKLGVKCPSCAWIPDGEAHWECDSCEGESFNTFQHGGECPRCGEVAEEIHCPECEQVAQYEWWWPADPS